MRFKAIVCSVLKQEVEYLLSGIEHDVDVVWMEQGLHATPKRLRCEVQTEIDRTHAEDYDGFIVGYGLCGGGIVGVEAKEVPVVIPRAHDCITLLLGSKEAYRRYFETHRGVYWYSPGWIDTGGQPGKKRYEKTLRDYEEKYGTELGLYLMKKQQSWYANYRWATYIDWGFERSAVDQAYTERCARELGWHWDVVQGDPGLLWRLLNGEWNEREVLLVRPGERVRVTHDEQVISIGVRAREEIPVDSETTFSEEGTEEQMSGLGLGVDAGGTYTDAVIYAFGEDRVVDKAKAPTTRFDLTVGIRNAIDQLNARLLSQVRLVSLSTTLATNAIVEEKGGLVGLILIGYDRYDETRIPIAPKVLVPGKHDMDGVEMIPLDEDRLREAVRELTGAGVNALAISSYLSVRNPDHEIRAKEKVRELTDLPVVCGHELTDELNAIRRATTAGLNGRLIPIVDELIRSVKRAMEERGIHAPLMAVKGDGTLMSEEMARSRPIETILSGPAASISGAAHLVEVKDATVVDIGGTTSDIAVLEGGLPRRRSKGTSVGSWQTSVCAVDIRTFGLGGDSYIQINRKGRVVVGPRRVIPLAALAQEFTSVTSELESLRSLEDGYGLTQPADFFVLVTGPDGLLLSDAERRIVEALLEGPVSRLALSKRVNCMHESLLEVGRLEQIGMVLRSALTPTDLLHVEGAFVPWNRRASEIGLDLYRRRLGVERDRFVRLVRKEIQRRLATQLVTANMRTCGKNRALTDTVVGELVEHALFGMADGPCSFAIQFNRPIIGIGAPVESMLPEVASALGAELLIPEHAEVANAIGAITGSVMITVEVLIRPMGEGAYVLHSPEEQRCFEELEEAKRYAQEHVMEMVRARAYASGAEGFDVQVASEDRNGTLAPEFGGTVFLETRVRGRAIGRPSLGQKMDPR